MLSSGRISMFVKFIIPCYNVGDTIGRMLDSILNQTLQDFHIVCVEDCSTDNTYEVLQFYQSKHPDKITLFKNQKNSGEGISRNRAYNETLESIPSEYVWCVDGDDYLEDDKTLEEMAEFCKQNSNLELICLRCRFNDKIINPDWKWPNALWATLFRTNRYEQALNANIQCGGDMIPHFRAFDNVEDKNIGRFCRICYVMPKAGFHVNKKELNNPENKMALINYLKNYKFKKLKIHDFLRLKYKKWFE